MLSKAQITRNWLPRYTGMPLEEFGEHILLTNQRLHVFKVAEPVVVFRPQILVFLVNQLSAPDAIRQSSAHQQIAETKAVVVVQHLRVIEPDLRKAYSRRIEVHICALLTKHRGISDTLLPPG